MAIINPNRRSAQMNRSGFARALKRAHPGLGVRFLNDTEQFKLVYLDITCPIAREAAAYYTHNDEDAAQRAAVMWNSRYAS